MRLNLFAALRRSRAPEQEGEPRPPLPLARSPAAGWFVIPRVKDQKSGRVLHLDQVPASYKRAVLVGEAGSGASSALRFLAGGATVLSLADFHPLAPPQHFDNPALILLDDVAPTRVHADYLARLLVERADSQIFLAAENPSLLPPEFTRLQLLPFHERERDAALRPWFGSRDAAREFRAAVDANPATRRLAFHPLSLLLLVQVYSPGARLPLRRAELFDAYLDVLLGSEPDPDFSRRALEGIALSVKRGQLAKEDHLPRGYGLLRVEESGRIGFVHKSIQDFLAARALQLNPDPAPLVERLADENWKQVVLFYAGLGRAEQAARVVDELLDAGRLHFAAVAVSQTPHGDGYDELREKVGAGLLPLAWRDRDPAAVTNLARIEWQGASDFFAARLRETDSGDRTFAVRAMGEIGTEAGLDAVTPLLRDPSAEVRDAVIAALGSSGSPLAAEPLLSVLRGDNRLQASDTRMRAAAARALGRLGTEQAVAALLVDLRFGDRELREAAAEALVEIRSPLAVEPLREIVLSDVADDVRALGHQVLNFIG